MLKKIGRFFLYLRWLCKDRGMEIHLEQVPCADGEHHTSYSFTRKARSTKVHVFGEDNFFLTSAENRLRERNMIRKMGFELETDRPLLPVIDFFIHYGSSSMVVNLELIRLLDEKDVANMSPIEKEFFAWCKKAIAGGLVTIHSGSCFGDRPSHQEECESMMDLASLSDRIDKGDLTGVTLH